MERVRDRVTAIRKTSTENDKVSRDRNHRGRTSASGNFRLTMSGRRYHKIAVGRESFDIDVRCVKEVHS